MPPGRLIDRRLVMAGLGAAASGLAARRAPARRPVVVVLGDSITSGYGLARPATESLPAQLKAALARLGRAVDVRNAGVTGDTAADALRRLDRSVPRGADLCLVALGGNDLLNGVDPARTRRDLTAIVRRLKARRIKVLLAGMRAPPILDPAYASAFDGLFAQVARTEGAAFYPFLLEGVALDARYNQRDRIHPNAEGVRRIAARLAPAVARALA